MRRVRALGIVLGISLLAHVSSASAEKPTPAVGVVDPAILKRQLLGEDIRIPIRLYGKGDILVRLRSPGRGASPLRLLTGELVSRREKAVVAGVYDTSRDDLQLRFALQDRRGTKSFYSLHLSPQSSRIRVIRGPEVILRVRGCGVDTGPHVTVTKALTKAGSTLRELEVAFDADAEYRSSVNTSLSSHVTSLVHAVNVFYERDLTLTLRTTKVNSSNTSGSFPSSLTNPESLLDRFAALANRTKYLGRTDVSILLSGKELDQGVIGLAYYQTACVRPAEAFAVVQHVNEAVDPVIVAHELGHTLGADHSEDGGIMSVALEDTVPDSFSPTSQKEIRDFVRLNGSCLAQKQITPAPTVTPTATPPTPRPSPTPTATPTTVTHVAATPVLRLKLSKDGDIRGSLDSGETGACTLFLLTTDRAGGINESRALAILPAASVKIEGKIRARVKPAKVVRNIYLLAQQVCPGKLSAESKVVRVNPRAVRQGRALGFQSWRSRFYRAIKVVP